MKIIVTIIPTYLVRNFVAFLSFLRIKNKNQNKNQSFSKLLDWQQEIFCFVLFCFCFVCSESRSSSKACRIQQAFIKEFSEILFLFVLQFHVQKDYLGMVSVFSDIVLGQLFVKFISSTYTALTLPALIALRARAYLLQQFLKSGKFSFPFSKLPTTISSSFVLKLVFFLVFSEVLLHTTIGF